MTILCRSHARQVHQAQQRGHKRNTHRTMNSTVASENRGPSTAPTAAAPAGSSTASWYSACAQLASTEPTRSPAEASAGAATAAHADTRVASPRHTRQLRGARAAGTRSTCGSAARRPARTGTAPRAQVGRRSSAGAASIAEPGGSRQHVCAGVAAAVLTATPGGAGARRVLPWPYLYGRKTYDTPACARILTAHTTLPARKASLCNTYI